MAPGVRDSSRKADGPVTATSSDPRRSDRSNQLTHSASGPGEIVHTSDAIITRAAGSLFVEPACVVAKQLPVQLQPRVLKRDIPAWSARRHWIARCSPPR